MVYGRVRFPPPVQIIDVEPNNMTMEEKFYVLPLNLSQLLVHTGKEDVCNTVAAVYSRNKSLLVVRPEYRGDLQLIAGAVAEAISYPGEDVLKNTIFGDAFHVDTWDSKIRDFEPLK